MYQLTCQKCKFWPAAWWFWRALAGVAGLEVLEMQEKCYRGVIMAQRRDLREPREQPRDCAWGTAPWGLRLGDCA